MSEVVEEQKLKKKGLLHLWCQVPMSSAEDATVVPRVVSVPHFARVTDLLEIIK